MKISREYLVQKVRDYSKKTGLYSLSRREFLKNTDITDYHIYRLFPDGGWTEIIELAGLEPSPKHKQRIPDEELLTELHRIAEELGRVPALHQIGARSKFSDATFKKRFGGKTGLMDAYVRWLETNDPDSSILAAHLESTKRSKKKPSLSQKQIPVGRFVSNIRIDELRKINSKQFDLSRLVKFCEELNLNYSKRNYFSVIFLTRAILDHVPPILNCRSFEEVANNYSGEGRSFRTQMKHLSEVSKKQADSYLHTQVRANETLPTEMMVEGNRASLETLLGEIIRVLSPPR